MNLTKRRIRRSIPAKWTAEIGGGGWGNQELQYYTNSTENAYHDGQGSLVIKAIKLTPPLTFKLLVRSVSIHFGAADYERKIRAEIRQI